MLGPRGRQRLRSKEHLTLREITSGLAISGLQRVTGGEGVLRALGSEVALHQDDFVVFCIEAEETEITLGPVRFDA